MKEIFNTPLTGLFLCFSGYVLGGWLQKKTRLVICNPILIAAIYSMLMMQVFDIPLEQFNLGGSIIQAFLAPATCVLALSIYRQRKILKEYFLPVLCGCSVGAIVSMFSSYFLSRLFALDTIITNSILPKSVTTAIAVEVSGQLNGNIAITILCVMITGMAGAIFAPYLIKLLDIKDPIEMGVSLGVSAHVIGTTKAIELGEIQGAVSGVAIGITGLVTVFLTLLL